MSALAHTQHSTINALDRAPRAVRPKSPWLAAGQQVGPSGVLSPADRAFAEFVAERAAALVLEALDARDQAPSGGLVDAQGSLGH